MLHRFENMIQEFLRPHAHIRAKASDYAKNKRAAGSMSNIEDIKTPGLLRGLIMWPTKEVALSLEEGCNHALC